MGNTEKVGSPPRDRSFINDSFILAVALITVATRYRRRRHFAGAATVAAVRCGTGSRLRAPGRTSAEHKVVPGSGRHFSAALVCGHAQRGRSSLLMKAQGNYKPRWWDTNTCIGGRV
ncbi:hypothetical protein BV22DRAFT_614031 [Leucogyrophana mollusca]|uniref:Uncharacterized protein n=1 Tax=Leucogyrophana mollusca TaxID=85980 RepID=A0ACB8BCP6_9AGAM|nr:hypothetical protein BV22DRAFT_614031 [Leucogyrophana mollusca]